MMYCIGLLQIGEWKEATRNSHGSLLISMLSFLVSIHDKRQTSSLHFSLPINLRPIKLSLHVNCTYPSIESRKCTS